MSTIPVPLFDNPTGIVLTSSADVIFVADPGNQCIRMISLNVGIVATVAATPALSINRIISPRAGTMKGPHGLALDPYDNRVLMIADAKRNTINAISLEEGMIRTTAGNGNKGHKDTDLLNSEFHNPTDIIADPYQRGDFYICDEGNHCIRKLSLSLRKIFTIAGKNGKEGFQDGTLDTAQFHTPSGIALDPKNNTVLFIADANNHCIRKMDIKNGVVSTLAGVPKQSGFRDGSCTEATFSFPVGIAVSPVDSNILLVCDQDNHRIRMVTPQNKMVYTVAKLDLKYPKKIAFDSRHPHIAYFSDCHSIQQITFQNRTSILTRKIAGSTQQGYVEGKIAVAVVYLPTAHRNTNSNDNNKVNSPEQTNRTAAVTSMPKDPQASPIPQHPLPQPSSPQLGEEQKKLEVQFQYLTLMKQLQKEKLAVQQLLEEKRILQQQLEEEKQKHVAHLPEDLEALQQQYIFPRPFEEEELIFGRVLGKGSVGTVYKCSLTSIPGSFAVKQFQLSPAHDDNNQTFHNELNALKQLNHPNIVKLIGYMHSTSAICLLMELYDCSLAEVILEKKKRLDVKLNTTWFTPLDLQAQMLQIARGLKYLHENTIAHRDIKTENILVRLKGINAIESLHIADFGVAKLCDTIYLNASSLAGTPSCIAPEVFNSPQDHTTYDPFKADIFSLGILLNEWLNGERKNRTLEDIRNGKAPPFPPSILTSNPKTSPYAQLIQLHDECIQIQPSKRPTAEKIVLALV